MKKKLFLGCLLMLLMIGCGSKPTFAEWLENNDEVTSAVEEMNENFADWGIHFSYTADGEDVLVQSIIYEEYQDLTGFDQSEIDATFAEMLNVLGASRAVVPIFDEIEEDAGVILKYIRIQFVNADGTVIYSQDYYDTE